MIDSAVASAVEHAEAVHEAILEMEKKSFDAAVSSKESKIGDLQNRITRYEELLRKAEDDLINAEIRADAAEKERDAALALSQSGFNSVIN
ncbi:hypothetical protein [Antarctobacter jejuensis]|uniref:hypothetical protein n=1 Tax=Antarctobacter jejuensis TaxID=1439938 RepID=UPI003FD52AAB